MLGPHHRSVTGPAPVFAYCSPGRGSLLLNHIPQIANSVDNSAKANEQSAVIPSKI